MLCEQTHTAIADLVQELRRILGPEGGRAKLLLKEHAQTARTFPPNGAGPLCGHPLDALSPHGPLAA